jgi:two-component system, NtrC family, response regulator AtoC
VAGDYDDIETDVQLEPSGAPQLCALISVDGVVNSVPLPERGNVRIGRESQCDVVILHKSVSRHHATLRIGLDGLEIVDAASRNGTRLRGSNLPPNHATPLTIGEAVQVGQATILIQHRTLVIDAAGALPSAACATPDMIARMLELECARSARSRSPFAFVRLHTSSDAHDHLLQILRASDAIGVDPVRGAVRGAVGRYQVLLLDTGPEQARGAIDRITQLLGQHGITARAGVARYPLDGVTPEQLSAHAWDLLHRAPGTTTAMDEVRALVSQVAGADVSVLITGETGVGKELCAEMIHRLSARGGKPFVKLNCAVFVESLIESELFGHERGAFTGAVAARAGLFETGDGGTVFLDEIGELPLPVQAKLLRVLEDGVVRRVGATTGKTLDVRFLCATNRALADEVEAGRFRRDLYYRINSVTISIPALRERRTEIGGLARAFAARSRSASGSVVFGDDAIGALERHSWPGNIRELRSTIERALMVASGAPVRATHLSIERPSQRSIDTTMPIPTTAFDGTATLAASVAELEKKRILDTLERCGGNQTRAARELGISRNTLLARLDAYGLPRPRKS